MEFKHSEKRRKLHEETGFVRITQKQKRILIAAMQMNEENEPRDVEEVRLSLEYQPTKQAFNSSLKHLIKKGLIERTGFECRRKHSRMILNVTDLGKKVIEKYSIKVKRSDEENEEIITASIRLNLVDLDFTEDDKTDGAV